MCTMLGCISSNTKECFINTPSNRTRRERASRFNDLCRSSPSPVTWPHRGRLNSFIQRSRLNFNYLKQKSNTRCLRKWQQDVVALIPPAELEHLHQSPPCSSSSIGVLRMPIRSRISRNLAFPRALVKISAN